MQGKKAVEELEGQFATNEMYICRLDKNHETISFSLARKIVKQREPFAHGECISIFSDFTETVGLQQQMYG